MMITLVLVAEVNFVLGTKMKYHQEHNIMKGRSVHLEIT